MGYFDITNGIANNTTIGDRLALLGPSGTQANFTVGKENSQKLDFIAAQNNKILAGQNEILRQLDNARSWPPPMDMYGPPPRRY